MKASIIEAARVKEFKPFTLVIEIESERDLADVYRRFMIHKEEVEKAGWSYAFPFINTLLAFGGNGIATAALTPKMRELFGIDKD